MSTDFGRIRMDRFSILAHSCSAASLKFVHAVAYRMPPFSWTTFAFTFHGNTATTARWQPSESIANPLRSVLCSQHRKGEGFDISREQQRCRCGIISELAKRTGLEFRALDLDALVI